MIRTVSASRRTSASPESLREALVTLRGASAIGSWQETTPFLTDVPVEAEVGDGSLIVRAELPRPVVPYFWWVMDPIVCRMTRNHLTGVAEAVVRSAETGEAPTEPSLPRWGPPSPMNHPQVVAMATLSFVLALTGYGGALLTQTINYVAQTFDATDSQLGLLTASTRVGTLVAIVGSALSDRWGRRRIILGAVALVSVATFASGLVGSLGVLAGLQILVRASATVAGVVAIIAVTEEAPEGGRAYTIAITGVAGSAGFALGSVLLPVADLGSQAWRSLYLLGGLGLLFLPGVSRRLAESHRYLDVVRRGIRRGRFREVVDRLYGGRFGLLVLTAFLFNLFAAPVSQFTNRYLGAERDFSGFDILILRGVTQTVTAIAATYVGGHIAEALGRKPAATSGAIVMGIGSAVFFLAPGPVLWIALLVGTAATAFAGPSLAAFNTELFPTEVRGTAGAGLIGAAVAGAVVGLVAVGYIADAVGSIGRATAVVCVAPVLIGALVVPRLPEAKGLLLDEVSPPEE